MQHAAGAPHVMAGMYGSYAMSREASGTAWQPEVIPHAGLHLGRGAWMAMFHGFANLVFDNQGGPRGGRKIMSTNMIMAMATRQAGAGRLGLRAMLSAEPITVGKQGYPLLLQTGETADGVSHLIDRQHPHDLFMELATAYTLADDTRSVFLYFGLPGEPALGPPAFMHRFSGVEFPESPIGHHWLDSSHITFGVLTVGAASGGIRLEASKFTGREPDEHRFDIETPKFDSHAFRASWNPSPAWALQLSYGRLESPEALEPEVNTDRTTASVLHGRVWNGKVWQSTLAWGRNRNHPGRTLDAYLLESALAWDSGHTLLARAERAQKDELFEEDDPRGGQAFTVAKLGAGYIYDAFRSDHVRIGAGLSLNLSIVPGELEDAYGDDPLSGLLFVRLGLR
jgi:hypothetical protein